MLSISAPTGSKNSGWIWYLEVVFHLCLWLVVINQVLFYWKEIPNLEDHRASSCIPLFGTLSGEEGRVAGCCPTSNGKRCVHSPLWKLTSCTSILTFLHNHTFPFIFGYIYCDKYGRKYLCLKITYYIFKDR